MLGLEARSATGGDTATKRPALAGSLHSPKFINRPCSGTPSLAAVTVRVGSHPQQQHECAAS